MAGRTARTERASGTRAAIITAAERLFAEHGVVAVSNRQISEAAGQGNNTAVTYHFGTKNELLRAIIRRHRAPMDELRQRMLKEIGGSEEMRDWVACLVRPHTEHLAELGNPTWYARCVAQVMADPVLRWIVIEEMTDPALEHTLDGINRCRPVLPPPVRRERGDMARHLLVHVMADRERALADDAPTPRSSWDECATGLIDALMGLWLAPVTPLQVRSSS